MSVINPHPWLNFNSGFWQVNLKYCARLLLAATIACGSLAVGADEPEWQVVKSKVGVEVSQSLVPGSPFKATRGTLLSDAQMFDVFSVLRDVEACGEWLHKCKQGRAVEEVGVAEAIYHTVIDSPLMLKDRETYVRSIVAYFPESQTLRIDMKGLENSAPLEKKRVRVLGFRGYWLVEQRPANQVHLTYEVHMDPQSGSVRVANSMLATSVLETLINVDRLAQEDPYRGTTVSPERLLQITRSSQAVGHGPR